jgi:hypothetical protein
MFTRELLARTLLWAARSRQRRYARTATWLKYLSQHERSLMAWMCIRAKKVTGKFQHLLGLLCFAFYHCPMHSRNIYILRDSEDF